MSGDESQEIINRAFLSLAMPLFEPTEVIVKVLGTEPLQTVREVYRTNSTVRKVSSRIRQLTEIALERAVDKYNTFLENPEEYPNQFVIPHVDYTHGFNHCRNTAFYAGTITAYRAILRTRGTDPHLVLDLTAKAIIAELGHDFSRPPNRPYAVELVGDHRHSELSADMFGELLRTDFDLSDSDIEEIRYAIRLHSNAGYGEPDVRTEIARAVMDGDGLDRHANFVPYIIIRALIHNERDVRRIKDTIFSHIARFEPVLLKNYETRTWKTNEGKRLLGYVNGIISSSYYARAAAILDEAFPSGVISDESLEAFLVEARNCFGPRESNHELRDKGSDEESGAEDAQDESVPKESQPEVTADDVQDESFLT